MSSRSLNIILPETSLKEEKEELMQKSLANLLKDIFKLAVPSTISGFLEVAIESVNTIFIG